MLLILTCMYTWILLYLHTKEIYKKKPVYQKIISCLMYEFHVIDGNQKLRNLLFTFLIKIYLSVQI